MGPSLSISVTETNNYIEAFYKTINQTVVRNTTRVVAKSGIAQSNVLKLGTVAECGQLAVPPTIYGSITLSNDAGSKSVIKGSTVGSLSSSLKETLRTDLRNFVNNTSETAPGGIFAGIALSIAVNKSTSMTNLVDEVINSIDWEQTTNCESEQNATQTNTALVCGTIYGDVNLNSKVFLVATASCISRLLVDAILQNNVLMEVLNETNNKVQTGGGGSWWYYVVAAVIIIIIIVAIVVGVTQANKKKAPPPTRKKPPPKKVTRPPMPLPQAALTTDVVI